MTDQKPFKRTIHFDPSLSAFYDGRSQDLQAACGQKGTDWIIAGPVLEAVDCLKCLKAMRRVAVPAPRRAS